MNCAPVKAGARYVEQHEHPGFRARAAAARGCRVRPPRSAAAARAQKARMRASALAGHVERGHGRLLDESGQPEQHAHRQALGVHAPARRGPTSQPARQPVMACDFDRLPSVTTRCGQALREARHATAGRESCVHLVRHQPQVVARGELRRCARAPPRCRMTPLGLFGVAQRIARVRGVIEPRRALPGRAGSHASAGVRTRRAPDTSMVAG